MTNTFLKTSLSNGYKPIGPVLLSAFLLMPNNACAEGYALRFDGVNDYIEISPHPSLDIRNQITIEAWVRWGGQLGVANHQIILNRDWIAYEIAIGDGNAAGHFIWAFGDVSTNAPDLGGGWREGGIVTPNVWTHLAVTYDGSRAKTYINGQLTGNYSASGRIRSQADNPVRIGQRRLDGHPSFFNGDMDEVRLWGVARTAEQINLGMSQALTGTESGLVAHWQFDEGAGQTAQDSTVNGNDARLGSESFADNFDPTWIQHDSLPPGNRPPTKPTVEITPHEPFSFDSLICSASGSIDPEGEPVSYTFHWIKNTEIILSGSHTVLDATFTDRGDIIACWAVPNDGEVDGEPGFDFVFIKNSLPSLPVVRILPDDPTPDDGLAIFFEERSVDPDGDLVLYIFEWFESSDGSVWNRRSELSGTPPPFYDRGEPEISHLFTQIGESWRIDITAFDVPIPETAFHNDKSNLELPLNVLAKGALGPKSSSEVSIVPDIDGDDIVGAQDLLYLRSQWKKTQGQVEPALRDIFFESGKVSSKAIGFDHLLNIATRFWQFVPNQK